MRPFVAKRESSRCGIRSIKRLKICKAARLRDSVGVVQPKKTLRVSFLNVDGLNEVTLEDVSGTIKEKNQDIGFFIGNKEKSRRCWD